MIPSVEAVSSFGGSDPERTGLSWSYALADQAVLQVSRDDSFAGSEVHPRSRGSGALHLITGRADEVIE